MKVFTTGQVAKMCDVAPRTVSKWVDSDLLKGYRIPGSQDRRIPRDYLIQFLLENNMPVHEDLEPYATIVKTRMEANALATDPSAA